MKRITVLKIPVFAAALIPAAALVCGIYKLYYGLDLNALTANPGDYITDQTGNWTIAFLMISLTVTPIRRLTKWNEIVKLRRMLGLFAFFYGCLHLALWLFLDPKQNTISAIWEDIMKRRYITIGMLAFLAMLPLAITSTAGWVRRLGFKRWKNLHKLIYLTAIAAVIHYWWLVKSDIRLPLMYAAIVAVLLGYRVIAWMRNRKRKPGVSAPQPTVSAG